MLQHSMGFDVLSTIRYNEHGDRIEEGQKFIDNARFEFGVPISFDSQGKPVPTKEKPEGQTVPRALSYSTPINTINTETGRRESQA